MANLNPAPGRRRVLTFATPAIDDLIFYELKDSKMPENAAVAYGTKHPDRNKYPDHVLVYIAPAMEPDPDWVRWYYAAERADQDDYNFEIDGDEYLTRTYIVPRADYLDGVSFSEPSQGTADAVFTNFNYVGQNIRRIGQQELDSIFVVVQRNYLNDGSTLSVSESGTPRGEESTALTLGANATSTALATGLILARSSRLAENDGWENTENRLSVRTGVNRQSTQYSAGYARVSSEELALGPTAPTGASGEAGFVKDLVTVDVNGTDALWTAQRETVINNPVTGSKVVRELGGGIASLTMDLVNDGTGATGGFYILDSSVDPIGDGNAVRTVATIDSYPTLIDDQFDETTKTMIRVTKDVIVPGAANGSYTAGNVTEIQAVDRWRSIQINSRYLTTPAPANRAGAIASALPFQTSFQIPAVLTSASLRYVYAWASSSGDYDYAEDLDLEFGVREQYSAAVAGRLLRYFSPTPPVIEPDEEVYKPESHSISYASSWWSAGSGGAKASAHIRHWQTPFALCEGITIGAPSWFASGGGLAVGQEVTSIISATATPPSGWTTVDVDVRPIKLGYYEVVERQLNLPDPFA
jgi:hypothetical protein